MVLIVSLGLNRWRYLDVVAMLECPREIWICCNPIPSFSKSWAKLCRKLWGFIRFSIPVECASLFRRFRTYTVWMGFPKFIFETPQNMGGLPVPLIPSSFLFDTHKSKLSLVWDDLLSFVHISATHACAQFQLGFLHRGSWKNQRKLLYPICRLSRPEVVGAMGTWAGFSSLRMAFFLPKCVNSQQ